MRKTKQPVGHRLSPMKPQVALAILAGAGLLNASAALAQQMQAPAQANAGAPPAAKAGLPGAATATVAAIGSNTRDAPDAPDAPDATIAPSQTVIVTGTVGATQAKRANVSYSVLDAKDLGKFTPISADDWLRDMPGVVVESNDGVARNESFTRGMTVGTGSPTSGNFWTSILEDGLPVVAAKFNNFQDSNFYRADISTGRVESIRGGSTGTTVASSAGGVFNYISAPIRPGTVLQTRLGWEGESSHLSWKQVDAYHGWRNEKGDLRASAAAFYRTSTGAADPGYALNLGGQLKLRVEKTYETAAGGSGDVSVTIKHLDDSNSWGSQFTAPSHGYLAPTPADGFPRDLDMFMRGGQHVIKTDAVDGPGGRRFHDPEKPAEYRQDALWIKWNHDTGGPWSFNSAFKAQDSQVYLQQGFYGSGPTSLWNVDAFQNAFVVNQGAGAGVGANLNRLPGVYELYDLGTGAVRARVQNNVGTANGINYRTGAACPAGAAASPAQCVTYTNLPNAQFDLAGGRVNGILVPEGSATSNRDVIAVNSSNVGIRASKDLMLQFMANYAGDNFNLQAGMFAVQANQRLQAYFNGRGISGYADGEVSNLGVRYVTQGGTYQLTDEGGWGRNGGGYIDGLNANIYRLRQRNLEPMLGGQWSPGKWDLNGSYKGTLTLAKTYTIPLITNPLSQGAQSRNYGGLDKDPQTWYDNQDYVRGTPVEASKKVYLKNYSASVGYNFTPEQKLYYRYSKAGNNIAGIINRYTTQFNADNRPLYPQADLKQDELAWVFGAGKVSGQLTAFRTELLLWQQQTPATVDGSTYIVEYTDHYVTRGLEGWLDWHITPKLDWNASVLYSKGRALAVGNFQAGSPGPEDDSLTTVAGIMSRTPKWVISNTVSYALGDFRFNLRHRFMDRRKLNNVPTDPNYLPRQRNTDLSIQWAGMKNLRFSLDVRNLLNDPYVAAYDTLLPTVTGVTKSDIYQQLPNSGSWVNINPPRSFWLTARYEF